LRATLGADEKVFVKLRGAFGEALVCTTSRVLILKAGWMTGQLFGTGMFQCRYTKVGGAQVTFHLVTGYFELSSGGMQNTPKSFWKTEKSINAAKAPNCVAIDGADRAARFRDACAFIVQRAASGAQAERYESYDELGVLERLAKLRSDGVISQAEFEAKKAQIRSRV
jgi:hypothetical protein